MDPEVLFAWIGIVLILGSLTAGATWGLLRYKRRLGKSAPQPLTPGWQWALLLAIMAACFLVSFATGRDRRPGQPPESLWPPPRLFLIWAGASVVWVVGFVAILFYRQYDRDASRALKLARDGDLDGAIADLKAAMDGRKPSAVRSNALGLLHSLREDWPEAYKAFLEAEALGGDRAQSLSNQGVALMKMGRLQDAAAHLADACSMNPTNALFAVNFGLALAELGRSEEARDQLARAEKNYGTTLAIPPSSKKPIGDEIERLREKLGADSKVFTPEL